MATWLDGLTVNRKEVFYTATLFPQIISAENFSHLRKFLHLLGPTIAEHAVALNGENVAVITEYNLRHAERIEAVNSETEQALTPDVVILLDGAPPLALVIEGKMFDTPNRGRLIRQIGMQGEHFVESLKRRMPSNSKFVQVALLPEKFATQVREVGNPDFLIVTWEDIEREYSGIVSAQHALRMLSRALRRWDQLVSSGSGFMNSDDTLTGIEVLKCLGADRPYKTMGRRGGLKGTLFQDDIKTGRWALRGYEVSRSSNPPNDNWFAVEAFVEELKRHASSS